MESLTSRDGLLKNNLLDLKVWENGKEIAHYYTIIAPSLLPPHSLIQVGLDIFSAQPQYTVLNRARFEFKPKPNTVSVVCITVNSYVMTPNRGQITANPVRFIKRSRFSYPRFGYDTEDIT